ncbi:MAG: hypothetical protein DI538_11640 [Azospira oryzae]|nr:MAG: hypothetical protein DI538_11640 [Azospira oryzae]
MSNELTRKSISNQLKIKHLLFGLIFVLAFTPKKIQSIPMISNYFKIALRSLWKNRTYSFINITGLAIGIAASVLILLYVSHEYSYDQFHKNGDQIYRLLAKLKWGETQIQTNALSVQFGPKLKEGSADVINYTRTFSSKRVIIQSDNDHRFFEDQFLFADSSFFSLFSFDITKGNAAALAKPGTVMITEEISKKYFGSQNPVGQILIYDKIHSFEVVGIVRKAPSNSSLHYDFIASFPSLALVEGPHGSYNDTNSMGLGSYITYVQIKSKEGAVRVEQVIPKLLSEKSADDRYILEPFTAIHSSTNANAQNINVFLFIALLILVLALVNYVNLTTARGTLRAKEVGIRKTIGAKRGALSIQFYFESALLTLIAFGLAMILIQTFTPLFLQTLQQDIDSSFLRHPLFISIVFLLLVTCIALSGGYPALVLSQFKPVEVLKGKFSANTKGTWIRKGFILFQFTASIALIICSMVVREQLTFMQTKSIGLNKEHVLVVAFDQEMKKNFNSLKEEIKRQSDVTSVAVSSHALYSTNGTNAYFTKTPTTNEEVMIATLSVDENFFHTLGMEWVSKETDSIKVGDFIINETALEKLKIKESDLGVQLEMGNQISHITGIIKDFNYSSLQNPINGMVITIEQDTASNLGSNGGSLYIRLDPKSSIHESVANIKNIYNKFSSSSPFHYYFLDDAFNRLYMSEDRLLLIVQTFTGIAIFIACLGLLGLITFSTERKMKEISIRKVLGASVSSILVLISREFIVLIAISLTIAAPIAWWVMNNWLQKFTYHINIPLLFIGIAGLMTLIFALITISFQSIRASIANPVDSLKNE